MSVGLSELGRVYVCFDGRECSINRFGALEPRIVSIIDCVFLSSAMSETNYTADAGRKGR
jgi:hypothetical protein